MRLLILGARGFVGSAVARQAVARGWTVGAVSRPSTPSHRLAAWETSLDNLHAELGDPAQIARLVAEWQPDAIVQAACAAGHGTDDAGGRLDYFQRGVAPGLALALALESVRYQGTLVHAGSAMSFGATGRTHAADDRLAPTTPRGVVKAACSLIYEQAALTVGFRFCEFFIYRVYGPWEQRERLISSLLRAALKSETLRLTPVGHPRNWVYVDDVAEACLAAAVRAPAGTSRVIIGSDCAVATTHEVARLVEALVGRRLVRDYTLPVTDRYGDKHLDLDPAPGLATIGWSPTIDLPSGLRATWDWASTPEGRRHLLG
ncbi:MAG: NAD(P)-dependent oxidoreductase [Opitutaceae bacterium]|nr:NAD(P)-dependent oxidoreductase [Opitutaceae bacterium]